MFYHVLFYYIRSSEENPCLAGWPGCLDVNVAGWPNNLWIKWRRMWPQEERVPDARVRVVAENNYLYKLINKILII